MKTYENEKAKLKDWILQKNREYDKAIDNDTTVGRDGKLYYERLKVVDEYNRRLVALKKKYGVITQNDALREQNTARDSSATYASGK